MRAPYPLLTLLVFAPLLGALGIGFLVPRARGDVARAVGIIVAALTFGLSVFMVVKFRTGHAGMQFVEVHSWVPSLGIAYRMGVDGISLFLLVLNAFLFPLALVGSYTVTQRVKHYTVLMLLLEGCIMGVFASTDLFLFFVFWEAMLVPMFLLIAFWGHGERVYAAVKFFLFTAAGSAFLLAGIVAVGLMAKGGINFDLTAVSRTEFSLWAQRLLFWAFTIAFIVKVPVFPFHTWLPDAHTNAPTAGSVVLAGVLLKMGTYGFLRFSIPLFPRAAVEAVPVLLTLAVIGIVYGALVAIRQKDAKRLIAYTSVSHLGFVVLGIFAMTTTGVVGGVAQMVNHGLSTGALFFLVGFLYERRHTREIAEFGGLKTQMPVYGAVFLFVALASVGLPGLNGFIGESLTLFGTFVVHRWWAVAATSGVILAAIYLLWMYQRMFHGKLDNPANEGIADLNATELIVLAPLMAGMLFIGIYPKPLLERVEPTVSKVIATVEVKTAGTPQSYMEPEQTMPAKGRAKLMAEVAAELGIRDAGPAIAQSEEREAARAERERKALEAGKAAEADAGEEAGSGEKAGDGGHASHEEGK